MLLPGRSRWVALHDSPRVLQSLEFLLGSSHERFIPEKCQLAKLPIGWLHGPGLSHPTVVVPNPPL